MNDSERVQSSIGSINAELLMGYKAKDLAKMRDIGTELESMVLKQGMLAALVDEKWAAMAQNKETGKPWQAEKKQFDLATKRYNRLTHQCESLEHLYRGLEFGIEAANQEIELSMSTAN